MNSAPDIASLKDYLEKNPDSLLFARVADAHLGKQELDEAISICEEGIKKHPYYVTGHFVLGKCYLAKGLYEQAEKEFKRVLLFDSRYVTAHKYYGDVMKEIGWENTCAMSYKKIVQIDPLDDIAREMAREYLEQGETESSQEGADVAVVPEEPADAIEPLPVTPEEEELMFERDPLAEDVQTVGREKKAEPEEEAKETEPAGSEPSKAPPQDDLDDREAEEFSTILDDIFKDEGVPSRERKSAGEQSEPDEAEQAGEELPETVLTDLGFKDTDEDSFPFKDEPDKDEPPSGPRQTNLEKPFEFAEHSSVIPEEKGTFGKKSRGKIVTPTLGEIYAAQGQYSKAIDVFETLLKKQPDNEFYSNKIAELKQKLSENKDASKG